MATKTSTKKTTKSSQKSTKAKKTTAKKAVKKTTTRKTTAKKAVPKKSAVRKSKEETIVEKVLNERNLHVVDPDVNLSQTQLNEIQEMALTGKPQRSIAKNAKQQAVIDSFNQIFESTVNEVMNLASYVPKPEIEALAKENPELLIRLRDAEPYTVHSLNGQYYLKTGIKTIEPVRDYLFKLEKVVIEDRKKAKEFENAYFEKVEKHSNELDELNQKLYTYENGGFFSLIKLAFKRLFKGVNNG